MPRLIILAAVTVLAGLAPAQFAGGTIFQSLDAYQPSNATQIGVPGNVYLSTGEVLTYTAGWTNGAKSLFNAEALGAILGDRTGNSIPTDWLNIDAFHISWQFQNAQPTVFDFRFSFEYDLINPTNQQTLITSGDIFKLNGIGSYQVTIPRSTFLASLGSFTPALTGYQINIDGYAELPDGSVAFGIKNASNPTTTSTFVGTAHVVNPLNGTTTSAIPIYGSDIFLMRAPYGSQPAILLWRSNDLGPIINTVLTGYNLNTLNEIRDFDLQPGGGSQNNPYDVLNLWNNGNRPHIVFHAYGDENVLCTNSATNGPSFSHLWALVEGTCATCGKYTTNGSSNQVAMDALAVTPVVLPAGSAITLDVSAAVGTGPLAGNTPVAPGTNVVFTARNLSGGSNRSAAIVLGATGAGATGYFIGTGGFQSLIINPNDAILALSLTQPYAAILTTNLSDANGSAATVPLTIPVGTPAITLYAQAVQLGPIYPLSAPTSFRIQ